MIRGAVSRSIVSRVVEAGKRVAELESEIERLRAMVPDAETREAIRELAENDEVARELAEPVAETMRGVTYYRPEIVFAWLDKLEAQKGETK